MNSDHSNERRAFAETLLAGTHSLNALAAEFGPGPGEDEPRDLQAVPAEQLSHLIGAKVLPSTAVQAYLDGLAAGELTHATADAMEAALETHYALPKEFAITSERTGIEGRNLQLACFYLIAEEK